MKAIKNLLTKLAKDEQGGEVLEYALIAGLIVVAAIAVIGSVGTKVLAKWTSLNATPRGARDGAAAPRICGGADPRPCGEARIVGAPAPTSAGRCGPRETE